jgi:hypothetical protein
VSDEPVTATEAQRLLDEWEAEAIVFLSPDGYFGLSVAEIASDRAKGRRRSFVDVLKKLDPAPPAPPSSDTVSGTHEGDSHDMRDATTS